MVTRGKLARREFLGALGASVLAHGCDRRRAARADADVATWPEKSAALILHTERPPNLEMPLEYLRHDLTPNDLMFVRWHLSGLPLSVDLRTFRLTLRGHVERPISLSYDELRSLEPVSLVAVNQCSGNSRSLFTPRIPGVQWDNGALGNATWTGVRLRTLFDRAGVLAGARCVTFRGLDRPPMKGPPSFVKALDLDRALDPDVVIAWAMNDRPLPMLNGFPVRLVVPGWYSTYWVKVLTEVTVLDAAFDGYWMAEAYRIPATEGADEAPDRLAEKTVPISRMNVRSLVVRPEPGARLRVGMPCAMEGIAFDGGSGIARVEVSVDGGASWQRAALDADLGRYSFRRWRLAWVPTQPGPITIVVRATSVSGEEQWRTPQWNRAGFMRNVYERTPVVVS